jgi:hypothetical protein
MVRGWKWTDLLIALCTTNMLGNRINNELLFINLAPKGLGITADQSLNTTTSPGYIVTLPF